MCPNHRTGGGCGGVPRFGMPCFGGSPPIYPADCAGSGGSPDSIPRLSSDARDPLSEEITGFPRQTGEWSRESAGLRSAQRKRRGDSVIGYSPLRSVIVRQIHSPVRRAIIGHSHGGVRLVFREMRNRESGPKKGALGKASAPVTEIGLIPAAGTSTPARFRVADVRNLRVCRPSMRRRRPCRNGRGRCN